MSGMMSDRKQGGEREFYPLSPNGDIDLQLDPCSLNESILPYTPQSKL